MAEIRRYPFFRHLRSEPSAHVMHFKNGRLRRAGPGLSLWFSPLSAAIAEIPLDDRELPFLIHGRSRDFQEVTIQGVITWRVTAPEILAERVDFSLNLITGALAKEPLEKISTLISQLGQQLALELVTISDLRTLLETGVDQLRSKISGGLSGDVGLAEMGLSIVSVRISAVQPKADLERALQMPTRERIQQSADEATFQRRAMAVEKERAIQENELQNQIELAKREETLIAQQGQNARRKANERVEAERVISEAKAARDRVSAAVRAEEIQVVEAARVNAEKDRMDIYEALPANVMYGLAARDLAGKLKNIEHLNVSPDLLGPMLTNLLSAGTKHLEGDKNGTNGKS